jgi:hypothetical protein
MKVTKREDYDALFTKDPLWQGADGLYCWRFGSRLLWSFCDTLVGESKTMIHNSWAASDFALSPLSFHTESYLSQPGFYDWPQDGYFDCKSLYLFSLVLKDNTQETFPLTGVEINQVVYQNGSLKQVARYPLMGLTSPAIFLGSEVLEEGDYLYLFGYTVKGASKEMVVARMTKSEFPKGPLYFLTQEGWNLKPEHLSILAHDISPEFQIVYAHGSYYLAYIKGSISGEIYLSSSPNWLGPFPKGRKIYSCPEQSKRAICYNAKILSALSDDQHLLLSYHVNALTNEDLLHTDCYRPHFLEVSL